ncbi:hypothetical protein [Novosphingobium sp. FKTRR1]|uniref:hypothetical protein n=1 Tax=Novosphingobium sp. FKTRR1 TaxID=2879118 RepID=UPI001CF07782|nr:hypothetical protein [Novosphingobium sp. FKTRR1]
MTDKITVSIDAATYPQLAWAASNLFNLDIPRGSNAVGLRAKIRQAFPDKESLEVPAKLKGAADEPEKAPPIAKPGQASGRRTISTGEVRDVAPAAALPTGHAAMHFQHDPKVEIQILPSSDPTRAKDVQVACQGQVILIRRGTKVKIPYRFYRALDDAIETVARDTDEINPQTGLPVKEWVEQHSYPFSIFSMPSDDEIAAWDKRMSRMQLA